MKKRYAERSNQTSSGGMVTASWYVTGPVVIAGDAAGEIESQPGMSQYMRPHDSDGPSKLTVTVCGGGIGLPSAAMKRTCSTGTVTFSFGLVTVTRAVAVWPS